MNETIFRPRPVARRPYLLSCVRISLLKRWAWMFSAALVAGVAAVVLGLSILASLALALLAAVVIGVGIAIDSWSRHSSDL